MPSVLIANCVPVDGCAIVMIIIIKQTLKIQIQKTFLQVIYSGMPTGKKTHTHSKYQCWTSWLITQCLSALWYIGNDAGAWFNILIYALPVYQWLSIRHQYLQGSSNGDAPVLHQAINIGVPNIMTKSSADGLIFIMEISVPGKMFLKPHPAGLPADSRYGLRWSPCATPVNGQCIVMEAFVSLPSNCSIQDMALWCLWYGGCSAGPTGNVSIITVWICGCVVWEITYIQEDRTSLQKDWVSVQKDWISVQKDWISVQKDYRQSSNICHTLEDNKIVDHSDVVGASPVGAARTTSSFST